MENGEKEIDEVIKKIEVCPNCKAITNGEKYCHNCGKYLLDDDGNYKYCSKCGNKLNINAKFCNKCGNYCEQQNSSVNNNEEEYESNEGTNSPIALAGLICAIVGLFVFPYILGIAAIVLGIIGRCQENISSRSKKQAVASIILGVIIMIWPSFWQGFLIGLNSTL